MKFLLMMTALSLTTACGRSTGDSDDEVAVDTETAGESGTSTADESESGTTASTTDDVDTSTNDDVDTVDTVDTVDGETADTVDTVDGETADTVDTVDGETDATESTDDSESTDSESTDDATESTESTEDTETGDPCLPEEIACDGLDEDCNDIIDDLDEEQDGFCDCYNIGIIGTQGANPAANFEAWLEDKGTDATRFGMAANHVLTEADLEPYDVLIVDRLTHTYSPAERQILTDWLAEGKGMIVMAGYTNAQIDRDQQNSLGSASGLTYQTPIYLNPVEVWENHPIAMGAQTVQIYGGWQVVGPGEVFVRPQGEPNNSFGTAAEVGMGEAIVFSDEWISFDSEWQAIPEVPVFWSNMIKWVGPKDICFDPQ